MLLRIKSSFLSFLSFIRTKRFFTYLLTTILFALVFFFSGYTIAGIDKYRLYFNVVLVLFAVFLFLYYIFTLKIPNEKKKPKDVFLFYLKQFKFDISFFYLVYIILIALLSMIVNKDFNSNGLKTFAVFACLFIAAYAFTKVVSFKNAVHAFRKIFPWICLVSLLFFALINLLEINYPFMSFDSSTYTTYNNYSFIYFAYIGLLNRNCSIFWEPALFSLFICLGIIFELVFSEKKFNLGILAIYFISLITTVSVSGFIVLFISLFVCLFMMKKETIDANFVFLLLIIIIGALCAVLLVLFVPGIKEKISINGKGGSMSDRFFGPYVNLRIAMDHPFGVSFSREFEYFTEYGANVIPNYSVTVQTCTFGYWISAFGIFGIIMVLFPFIALFFNKKINLMSKITLIPLLIVIMISEPLQNNLVMILFVFYCINEFSFFSEKRLVSQAPKDSSSILQRFLKNSNNSIFARNSIGTIVVKGIAMLISLFTTSAYITYFADPKGEGMLAVWLTILSVLTWILVFDMGIGHGLKNKLISAYENNDDEQVRKIISSAYIPTAIISLVLLLVGSFLIWLGNMHSIFNIDANLIDAFSLKMSLWIILLGICLNFVLKIIGNIFESLQKQAISNILAVCQTAIILLFVTCFSFGTNSQRLIGLAVAYLIASTLPMLIATVVLFTTKFRKYHISPKAFSFESAKSVMSLGGMFFAIQICMLLINSTNTFIIQNAFGADGGATAQYTYYHKMFNICVVFAQLLAGPIWTIITKAKSTGDRKYIMKLNRLLLVLSSLFVLVELLVFAALPIIFKIWIPNAIFEFSWLIDLIFAINSILVVISVFFTSVCNGLSKLKYQIIGFGIGLILKVLSVAAIIILNGRGFNIPWYFIELTTAFAYIPVVILVPIGNHKYIEEMVHE